MKKGSPLFLIVFVLLLIVLLAFALGAILARQERTSAEYQMEMEALHLKTEAKMQAIKVGLRGGLAVVILLSTIGLTAGLVRAVWQRSRLIHPHDNGLFPVVQGRAGGQTYYHDPNRQLAGTAVYGSSPEGTTVRHPTLPAERSIADQLQVTTQAQAAQLVAAAGQGQGLTAQSRQLAERVALATTSRPAPRLPQVVVLDKTIPEERQLLTALRRDWKDE
jgi:hypothetical protein